MLPHLIMMVLSVWVVKTAPKHMVRVYAFLISTIQFSSIPQFVCLFFPPFLMTLLFILLYHNSLICQQICTCKPMYLLDVGSRRWDSTITNRLWNGCVSSRFIVVFLWSMGTILEMTYPPLGNIINSQRKFPIRHNVDRWKLRRDLVSSIFCKYRSVSYYPCLLQYI